MRDQVIFFNEVIHIIFKSAHFYPDSGECYFNSENRLTRPEMYIEIDPNKPEDQGVIYLEPCNKGTFIKQNIRYYN